MFILDPKTTTNTTTAHQPGLSAQKLLIQRESQYSKGMNKYKAQYNHHSFDQMVKLRALFLGLIKQSRWIYFLNDSIQLKAEHLPVLQVKLKEHHTQYDCIARIANSGHCSAIVIEKNQMSEQQLEDIQLLCIRQKVQIILLENLIDGDTLH